MWTRCEPSAAPLGKAISQNSIKLRWLLSCCSSSILLTGFLSFLGGNSKHKREVNVTMQARYERIRAVGDDGPAEIRAAWSLPGAGAAADDFNSSKLRPLSFLAREAAVAPPLLRTLGGHGLPGEYDVTRGMHLRMVASPAEPQSEVAHTMQSDARQRCMYVCRACTLWPRFHLLETPVKQRHRNRTARYSVVETGNGTAMQVHLLIQTLRDEGLPQTVPRGLSVLAGEARVETEKSRRSRRRR